VQEGGTAPQVTEDEERFFDGLCFVGREENVVEPETEPVDERAGNPDQVEQYQEDDPFFGEAGGGVFRIEDRTVKGTPEEAEVVVHGEVGFL
jgi:hypothetical protein